MTYRSESRQRLLRLVEAAGERPLEWQDPRRLAAEVGAERSSVFRDLKNLEEAGWMEANEAGFWRLSPKLTRIAERLRREIGEIHRTYLGDGQ